MSRISAKVMQICCNNLNLSISAIRPNGRSRATYIMTLWRALGTEQLVDEVLPWAVDAEFRKQSSSTLALVKSSSRWLFFSYSRTHPIHI